MDFNWGNPEQYPALTSLSSFESVGEGNGGEASASTGGDAAAPVPPTVENAGPREPVCEPLAESSQVEGSEVLASGDDKGPQPSLAEVYPEPVDSQQPDPTLDFPDSQLPFGYDGYDEDDAAPTATPQFDDGMEPKNLSAELSQAEGCESERFPYTEAAEAAIEKPAAPVPEADASSAVHDGGRMPGAEVKEEAEQAVMSKLRAAR